MEHKEVQAQMHEALTSGEKPEVTAQAVTQMRELQAELESEGDKICMDAHEAIQSARVFVDDLDNFKVESDYVVGIIGMAIEKLQLALEIRKKGEEIRNKAATIESFLEWADQFLVEKQ